MAQCPNCGASVEEGAPVCDSCGMSLGDDLAGDEGQDAGQGDSGGGGGAQHDHAEGGHQHAGDPQQGGQPQQGQPQGGQPQGRQPQGGQPQQGRAQGGQPQGGQPQGGQPRQGQGQPRQGQPQGGQPQGGQPRQGQGGQPQGGQPRQGQPQGQAPPQGGQPRQGQPQQGQYGQQGQYRQPQDDEVVAGLSRRQVLGIGGAGIGVLAIGGFVLLGGSGGPAGTAESFVNALNNGDTQAAADLLHPDSGLTEQQVGQFATTFGPAPLSVDGAEVTQQSDGQATVQVSVTFQGNTQQLPVQVRQANGEWLVYRFSGA